MLFVVVGACMTLAAITLAAAAPAGASGVGPRAGRGTLNARFTLSTSVVKNTAAAGYVSEKSHIKSVSTVFEVPEITNCKSGDDTGMGPVVILLGTGYFVGAGAEAECQKGTTSYRIAINHNGTESHPLIIAARNKISVDVTIGSKAVSVKIEDLTTKAKVSQSVPKGKVTAALLGDDALVNEKTGVQFPIPKFTNHQFTDAKINGKVLKDAKPLLDVELVINGKVLIKAGPLNKAGDSFVMLFEHAS
jgi:hypothetical protein